MTPDERAIRDVVEMWMTATRDGDLTTVLSLMTDDVVFMVPGKEPFGKEAFAAQSAGMSNVRFDGRHEVQELQVLGEWAYLRNYIDLTVRPADGPPARRVGYTLTIFRRQSDGRWLLSRDANLLTAREG
jgi:uncharacterized protein (TIGR02246 family)